MFVSLTPLAEELEDFDSEFTKTQQQFEVMSTIVPIIIVVIVVLAVGVGIYRFIAVRRQGMDPLAADVQLMGRAYRSQLLAPADSPSAEGQSGAEAGSLGDTRSKSQRLEEIESMYRSGSITAEERQRARDAILTD